MLTLLQYVVINESINNSLSIENMYYTVVLHVIQRTVRRGKNNLLFASYVKKNSVSVMTDGKYVFACKQHQLITQG